MTEASGNKPGVAGDFPHPWHSQPLGNNRNLSRLPPIMAKPPPEKPKTFRDRFVNISKHASNAVGSVWAFLLAVLIVVIWGCTGPLFKYSDTWQLVINT